MLRIDWYCAIGDDVSAMVDALPVAAQRGANPVRKSGAAIQLQLPAQSCFTFQHEAQACGAGSHPDQGWLWLLAGP